MLIGAVLVTSPGVPFFSDEGAAIIQARLLERTGSWVEANPFPTVDPLNAARTIPHADVGIGGRAPYAKHPAFPLLLAFVDRLAGSSGFLALTVAGTLGAAAAAGLLAARLDRRLSVGALWLTGLGTPLLFDGAIVIAHAEAAALAGVATLALLACLRSRFWLAVAWSIPLFLATAGAVALRSEAQLFALGLTAAATSSLLQRGWPKRTQVIPAILGLVAPLLATVIVRVGERAAFRRHLGAHGGPPIPNGTPGEAAARHGFLVDQTHGLLRSWFTVGVHPSPVAALLLLGALVAVGVAGVLTRRRPDLVPFLLALAVGGFVGRLVLGSSEAIAGLMVVFPVGWFAMVACRRRDLLTPDARSLRVIVVVFGIGVLATQYSNGGGIEWGGRYFAIGIPAAIPLVIWIVRLRLAELPERGRRQAGAFLLASTAICSLLSLASLAHGHRLNRSVIRAIVAASARASRADGEPVVVTPERFAPQIDWPHYFDYRWLAPERGALGSTVASLYRTGQPAFILVTAAPAVDFPAAAPYLASDQRQVAEFRVNVPANSPPVVIATMTRSR